LSNGEPNHKNGNQNFIDAINAADVDKLYSLMTDDHIFIDSQIIKSQAETV